MFQGAAVGGIDFTAVAVIARELAALHKLGAQVAVVVGGGNMFRGRDARNRSVGRVTADSLGMLGTIMNAMALRAVLERQPAEAVVFSAVPVAGMVEPYQLDEAARALRNKKIIILAGGTGNPYFSTDTAVVLRALELTAGAVFKATKTDGVYDKDPFVEKNAKKYDTLTYAIALKKKLGVMDQTAFALAANNDLPIVVFKFEPGALVAAAQGKKIGTIVQDRV